MNIKNGILLGAGALVVGATFLGICTALFGHNPETVARLVTVSSILGTGSIGLFFVGLAFPRTIISTTTNQTDGSTLVTQVK